MLRPSWRIERHYTTEAQRAQSGLSTGETGVSSRNEPGDVMSQQTEKGVLGSQPALALLFALKQVCHRPGALLVPCGTDLSVGQLFREHGEDVLAVDDLRMVVRSKNTRDPGRRVRGDLDHRQNSLFFGFEGERSHRC